MPLLSASIKSHPRKQFYGTFQVGQQVKPKCPNSPLNHPEAKIVVRSVSAKELIVDGYYPAGFVITFPIKPESLIAISK